MKTVGHIKVNEDFESCCFGNSLLNVWYRFLWNSNVRIDWPVVTTESDEWWGSFGRYH